MRGNQAVEMAHGRVIAGLRADLAALRMKWALFKLARKYNFDPAHA